VAGGWRRLHNEELHNLYASPNIMRVLKSGRMGCAAHVARMGWMERNAYKILIRKPERNRPLGRPRRRREDNIRLDLRGIGWRGVDWICLASDRGQGQDLVNTVMNITDAEKEGNFLRSLMTLDF